VTGRVNARRCSKANPTHKESYFFDRQVDADPEVHADVTDVFVVGEDRSGFFELHEDRCQPFLS